MQNARRLTRIRDWRRAPVGEMGIGVLWPARMRCRGEIVGAWRTHLSGRQRGRRERGVAYDRQGGLLQEGIDVAVILNALRALRGGQVRWQADAARHAGPPASLRGRFLSG